MFARGPRIPAGRRRSVRVMSRRPVRPRTWACAHCGAHRPPERTVCRPCGGIVWISAPPADGQPPGVARAA
jgi:hypothetical protein